MQEEEIPLKGKKKFKEVNVKINRTVVLRQEKLKKDSNRKADTRLGGTRSSKYW
jgi:hypothetical protein